GGTGRQAGRGGGRTRGRSGNQGDGRNDGPGGQVGGQGSEVNGGVDGVPNFSTIIAQQLRNLLPTIVAQVGNQGRGKRSGRNQNDKTVNDHIRGDLGNATEGNDLHDMSGCRDSQRVKYSAGLFVGKALTWWNSEIRTRGREAAIGFMSWLVKDIQKVVQLAGTLTDKALRNGSIKKNPEKRGNVGEPSKDRNEREDNKRTRTGSVFAMTTNPIRGGYMGTTPKCTASGYHHSPETPCRMCFNCNRIGYFARDYRVVPRNVESGSKARGNHQNQVVAVNGGQGRGNQRNQARGRAFMLGAEEACQDPNVVMGFSYEIEIANGQLVEIDKVIRGCKLEIEGHGFDINLIPFGSESFDVIIGMDWLSDHKAEIVCHEKAVRIPLLDGKVLRVLGEKPKEKMRQLMSAKAKEKEQEEIVVVRDFLKVFSDDLSRLPSVWEIVFRIELIPRATPVAKSPYRLAPSELKELLGQIKELQEKGFIQPSSLP
ncbi:putative reverse transcriptase domain-containing protein, partial [Tanacetum coccineum]